MAQSKFLCACEFSVGVLALLQALQVLRWEKCKIKIPLKNCSMETDICIKMFSPLVLLLQLHIALRGLGRTGRRQKSFIFVLSALISSLQVGFFCFFFFFSSIEPVYESAPFRPGLCLCYKNTLQCSQCVKGLTPTSLSLLFAYAEGMNF